MTELKLYQAKLTFVYRDESEDGAPWREHSSWITYQTEDDAMAVMAAQAHCDDRQRAIPDHYDQLGVLEVFRYTPARAWANGFPDGYRDQRFSIFQWKEGHVRHSPGGLAPEDLKWRPARGVPDPLGMVRR